MNKSRTKIQHWTAIAIIATSVVSAVLFFGLQGVTFDSVKYENDVQEFRAIIDDPDFPWKIKERDHDRILDLMRESTQVRSWLNSNFQELTESQQPYIAYNLYYLARSGHIFRELDDVVSYCAQSKGRSRGSGLICLLYYPLENRKSLLLPCLQVNPPVTQCLRVYLELYGQDGIEGKILEILDYAADESKVASLTTIVSSRCDGDVREKALSLLNDIFKKGYAYSNPNHIDTIFSSFLEQNRAGDDRLLGHAKKIVKLETHPGRDAAKKYVKAFGK